MGRADANNRLRKTAHVLTKLAKRKFFAQLSLKKVAKDGSLNTTQKPDAMNRPTMKSTGIMDGEVRGG
jgi:hypothetical protein